jgi:hypothetical protein
MRRCGKRYKDELDARGSKRGQQPGAAFVRCCLRNCGGWHVEFPAAARSAGALGWRRIITYNEDGESGASLRAAGYGPVAELKPRAGWDSPSRPRDGHGNDSVGRIRWERICNPKAGTWTVPARPADHQDTRLPEGLWEAAS